MIADVFHDGPVKIRVAIIGKVAPKDDVMLEIRIRRKVRADCVETGHGADWLRVSRKENLELRSNNVTLR